MKVSEPDEDGAIRDIHVNPYWLADRRRRADRQIRNMIIGGTIGMVVACFIIAAVLHVVDGEFAGDWGPVIGSLIGAVCGNAGVVIGKRRS
jgi:hypothetical protein